MTIQLVSAATVVGATMALPQHQPGDLIFLAVIGSAVPVGPSGLGWRYQTGAGTGGYFIASYWRHVFSKSEQCGEFGNAVGLSAAIYRSDLNLGLSCENFTTRIGNLGTFGLPPFSPIRNGEVNGTAPPSKRVCGVSVQSLSANLSANLPQGWTLQTVGDLSTPITAKLGVVDFDFPGGAMLNHDVSHTAGNVQARSVSTAVYETPYSASAGRGFNSGFSGNGIGVF